MQIRQKRNEAICIRNFQLQLEIQIFQTFEFEYLVRQNKKMCSILLLYTFKFKTRLSKIKGHNNLFIDYQSGSENQQFKLKNKILFNLRRKNSSQKQYILQKESRIIHKQIEDLREIMSREESQMTFKKVYDDFETDFQRTPQKKIATIRNRNTHLKSTIESNSRFQMGVAISIYYAHHLVLQKIRSLHQNVSIASYSDQLALDLSHHKNVDQIEKNDENIEEELQEINENEQIIDANEVIEITDEDYNESSEENELTPYDIEFDILGKNLYESLQDCFTKTILNASYHPAVISKSKFEASLDNVYISEDHFEGMKDEDKENKDPLQITDIISTSPNINTSIKYPQQSMIQEDIWTPCQNQCMTTHYEQMQAVLPFENNNVKTGNISQTNEFQQNNSITETNIQNNINNQNSIDVNSSNIDQYQQLLLMSGTQQPTSFLRKQNSSNRTPLRDITSLSSKKNYQGVKVKSIYFKRKARNFY